MTFINPSALAALFAVSLPLLIHLFSRRKHRELDFSTLKFLKKLQDKRLRKIRIAEILLLLLRMLAVACIVLAFARPALKSGGGVFQGEAGIDAIIIIDNSLPTQAIAPEGSVIAQVRNSAAELAGIFGAKDKITIIPTSSPNDVYDYDLSSPENLDKPREKLFEMEFSAGAPQWNRVLSLAITKLQDSQFPNHEVYIISPFYSKFELSDSIFAVLSEGDFRLFNLIAGPDKINNLTVLGIELVSSILQAGMPADFAVDIANYSDQARENIPLSLYLQDERAAALEISLAASEARRVFLKAVPQEVGFNKGSVKIETDDALSVDNQAFFAFNIPEEIEIVLAGERDQIENVRLALGGINSDDKSFKIRTLSSSAELIENFNTDAIYLLGAENLSSLIYRKLLDFVERGGGLLIAPSEKTDINQLNRNLLEPTNAPLFGEIFQGEYSWGKIDLKHPLFASVFGEKAEPQSPLFYKYFRLLDGSGSNIIEFRDGAPFLSETEYGQGKIMLLSSPISDDWNDILHRGIFPPLMHRIAYYLHSKNNLKLASVTAGEALEFSLNLAITEVQLVKPNQTKLKILPDPATGRIALKSAMTTCPGIYSILVEDKIVDLFSVNPAVEYSDLRRVDILKSGNVIPIAPQDDIKSAVSAGRVGLELWRWLLFAGIFILIVELIIGRLVK